MKIDETKIGKMLDEVPDKVNLVCSRCCRICKFKEYIDNKDCNVCTNDIVVEANKGIYPIISEDDTCEQFDFN